MHLEARDSARDVIKEAMEALAKMGISGIDVAQQVHIALSVLRDHGVQAQGMSLLDVDEPDVFSAAIVTIRIPCARKQTADLAMALIRTLRKHGISFVPEFGVDFEGEFNNELSY